MLISLSLLCNAEINKIIFTEEAIVVYNCKSYLETTKVPVDVYIAR